PRRAPPRGSDRPLHAIRANDDLDRAVVTGAAARRVPLIQGAASGEQVARLAMSTWSTNRTVSGTPEAVIEVLSDPETIRRWSPTRGWAEAHWIRRSDASPARSRPRVRRTRWPRNA